MNETTQLEGASRIVLSKALLASRYLVFLALVLAGAGQYLLSKTNAAMPAEGQRQLIAGVLLIVGAIAFGLATRRFSEADTLSGMAGHPSEVPGQAMKQWLLVLVTSILLALSAIMIFETAGENPTVVGLWIISIVLLLAAQFRGIHVRIPRIPATEWPYLAGVVLLIGSAIVTRTYHLTTLPYNLDGDFAEVGNQARALVTGQTPHIFTYGWANIPVLGYLPPAFTMLFFGTGLEGLNMSGVLEGLLILLGVYLLGRELFNSRVGLFATAILTVSYTDLAASRQSVYIDPAFFMLFATYFLVIGLKRTQGWAVVLSGILTALCLELYYAGRLIIPIGGSALLYALLFQRSWLAAHWRPVVLWALAVLVTLGPMLLVFASTPGQVSAHTEEVFILNPALVTHSEGVFGVHSIADVLLQQARHTALLFNYYPDKGTQFALGLPYLDPFTAVIFVLGLGTALFAWKRLGAWLMLWWLAFGLFFGSFLTGNPPFWPRLIILLPPVGLICGLMLDRLSGYLMSTFHPQTWEGRGVLPLVLAFAFFWLGVMNWNSYVQAKGNFALPRTRIGRYLAGQPSTARAYLVSNGYTYRDREFNFLCPGRLAASLTPDQLKSPIPPIGSPTLLILTTDEPDAIKQLQQQYPGAPQPGNSPGEIAFYVFHLP